MQATWKWSGLALLVLTVLAPVTSADSRPFTFTYDTYPVGKGQWEYEQWVTYRTSKEGESDYHRIDFRHELEFGITDTFDLHLYLPTWRYEDSTERTGTKFDRVDVAALVYLSNPTTDWLGAGLYFEVGVGEDEVLFEQKLLIQKDVGKWILAYNFIVETEIEGLGDEDEENEIEGELGHTLGVSYALSGDWFVGGEVVVESAFEDWAEYEGTTVYAGPAVSYQGSEWFWVTMTPTYQLTDNEDEADFQVRLIAALQF